MARIAEGKMDGSGKRIGLIVSRFNNAITDRLLEGALDCLRRHGVEENRMHVLRVPGAFEIAHGARKLAGSGRYDAVICLGAIIRGSTPHFDYISGEVTRAVGRAGEESGLPVIYGLLTTDTIEQAVERSGVKLGNKGWEAALAALEMTNLPIEDLASWD